MELNNLTEVEILRVQVAQLREALERIEDISDYACYCHVGDTHPSDCAVGIARAALAATPADTQAWLERQRKLAAADALEQLIEDTTQGLEIAGDAMTDEQLKLLLEWMEAVEDVAFSSFPTEYEQQVLRRIRNNFKATVNKMVVS